MSAQLISYTPHVGRTPAITASEHVCCILCVRCASCMESLRPGKVDRGKKPYKLNNTCSIVSHVYVHYYEH